MADRRFQFSSRSLLIGLLVAGLVLGSVASWFGAVRSERVLLDELAGCQPTYIRELGRVVELRLTGSVEDKDLIHLHRFKRLHTLDLAASRYRGGVSPVVTPGNRVTDGGLAYLSDLRDLDWLSLRDTGVSDEGLRHLAKLDKLRVLILDGTQVSGPGLVHLADLPKLDHLQLNSSVIQDDGLAELSRLIQVGWFELRNTRITDRGLGRLRGMENLELLSLEGTGVTAAGIRDLQAGLPNCRIEWSATLRPYSKINPTPALPD